MVYNLSYPDKHQMLKFLLEIKVLWRIIVLEVSDLSGAINEYFFY